MNVNLNTIRTTGAATMPAEIAPETQKSPTEHVAALSITQASASPDEIAAAKVPEASFARNDPLGQLVASAFNLPPPPFPTLPES